MEILLEKSEQVFFSQFYNATLPLEFVESYFYKDSNARIFTTIFILEIVGVNLLYFLGSGFSWYFLFDKSILSSKKMVPNQIWREIKLSVTSFPITALVTAPWLFFEVKGYSRLYYSIDEYGWLYFTWSLIWFILFTDFGVYWIHRFEHAPFLYSWLHKPHHQWKITTPWASFAFHPLDGYFQSLPIHIFVYLFPFNIYAYLGAFILVQFWTIAIHDRVYLVNNSIINGAAHHTVHHLEFNYNYGQYFTLWDRIGGSYKEPREEFKNMYFSSSKKD